MGIIYKLTPEVKEFIIERKKNSPSISCRSLVALVNDKFHIKVSKSSINSIFKESGLSLPVGRRQKLLQEIESKPNKTEPEPVTQIEAASGVEPQYTGAILLKAADFLIGGSKQITEFLKTKLINQEENLLAKTEGAIYLPLFEVTKEENKLPALWALIDKRVSLEEILSYLNNLQSVSPLLPNILRIISNILQEVRCIKLLFSDESFVYLDGQMYTTWLMSNLPMDFSSTLYSAKSYANRCFNLEDPIVLLTAPGYDIPSREFFNFILSLEFKEKNISKVILYGNKLEELDVLSIESKRRRVIFGLWPWQFLRFRKVKRIGEFKPFCFQELQREFYLAEAELELSQPGTQQYVTLKGTALKSGLNEKIQLVILSNMLNGEVGLDKLAEIYLKKWPNPEEAFEDFSRKIELFTYTARSHSYFSPDNIIKVPITDMQALFSEYFSSLDSYVKWHFLPPGYENKDFSTMKEQFYDLKATFKAQTDYSTITFQVPAGYHFLEELTYVCRRLKERQILCDGKKLWFRV